MVKVWFEVLVSGWMFTCIVVARAGPSWAKDAQLRRGGPLRGAWRLLGAAQAWMGCRRLGPQRRRRRRRRRGLWGPAGRCAATTRRFPPTPRGGRRPSPRPPRRTSSEPNQRRTRVRRLRRPARPSPRPQPPHREAPATQNHPFMLISCSSTTYITLLRNFWFSD